MRARAALWLAVGAGACAGLWLFASTLGDATLGPNGAIHAALACDLRGGELYRPVMDARGYGGTRYMPGFFVLYAAMMRLVPDVVLAGVALEQITVLLLVAAVYAVLRRMDVARPWAMALSGLVICTDTWRLAAFDPRADYLSSALVVTSLLLVLDGRPAGGAAAVVAAVFVKITSGVFVVVPLVALLREGRRREAIRLGAACLAACGAGMAVIDLASGGRFLEGLAATWTAGTPLSRTLLCLFDLVNDEARADPIMGVGLLVGLVGLARVGAGPLGVFCAAALAEALLTHMSRGTGTNHLILLHVACILVMGRMVAAGVTWPVEAGALAVVLLVALGLPPAPLPRRSVQLAMVADLPRGARLLSDNPVLPLLRGERPFLLDAYNLRWMVEQGTPVGRDFEARVRAKAFDAIVLTDVEARGAAFFHDTYPAWRRLEPSYHVVPPWNGRWVRLVP